MKKFSYKYFIIPRTFYCFVFSFFFLWDVILKQSPLLSFLPSKTAYDFVLNHIFILWYFYNVVYDIAQISFSLKTDFKASNLIFSVFFPLLNHSVSDPQKQQLKTNLWISQCRIDSIKKIYFVYVYKLTFIKLWN